MGTASRHQNAASAKDQLLDGRPSDAVISITDVLHASRISALRQEDDPATQPTLAEVLANLRRTAGELKAMALWFGCVRPGQALGRGYEIAGVINDMEPGFAGDLGTAILAIEGLPGLTEEQCSDAMDKLDRCKTSLKIVNDIYYQFSMVMDIDEPDSSDARHLVESAAKCCLDAIKALTAPPVDTPMAPDHKVPSPASQEAQSSISVVRIKGDAAEAA